MAPPTTRHSSTPTPHSAPRILIIKPSSLGDIVHALPTVNGLRQKFPDAHIAWLVNDSLGSLLNRCPIINEVIPFPRHVYSQLPALVRRLRAAHYDLVLDLQGLLRSGLITAATGAARRVGLSDAREGSRLFYNEIVSVPRLHAVDRYLLAARYLGCPTTPVEFPLGLEGAAPAEPKPIAINPSARWPTKLWGDDKFAELIHSLPRDRIVLTGSAAERERIDRLAPGCRNLAGKTDLLALAELYRRCAVVITNDSGPMHIAAAVGTPVIAIFGPTDPLLTGPYGRQHIVLRAGIPCSPCLNDRCTHQPPMECMSSVTVAQVLAAAKPFIA
jgi:lipopolysaccharide heptosyltransferase I